MAAVDVDYIVPPTEERLKTKNVLLLILQILFLALLTIPLSLLDLVKMIFPSSKKSLKDQVVLVTGAGRGLGKGLALGLAKEGCKVAVADINKVNAEQTAAEIVEAGGVAKAYFANVALREDVAELHSRVSHDFGPVDVLVNNAGVIVHPGHLQEHSTDQIRTTIDVNLTSHFWMIQEILPTMKQRNSGHIVAIVSMSGYAGFINGSAYTASKYGVRGMMEVLREELNSKTDNNVKTTTVFPYFINTSADYMKQWDLRIAALSIDEVVEKTITAVREDQELLMIPKYIGLFAQFKELLPKYVQDLGRRIVYMRVSGQTTLTTVAEPNETSRGH